MPPRVSICTVTFNAAADLREYFAALFALTHRPLDVVIADCASSDDSVAIAREFGGGPLPVRVLALGENRGFAGGSGAATLLSGAAIDDVVIAGEVFDPEFFTFGEDAELCFRLRERGWEVI